MPYRAAVKHMSGDLRPPDVGSRASFGRWTSWSTSSLVSLARSDSLPFWSFAEKPFVSVGTMKPRIALASSSAPVFAHTTATCAVDPFVIHIFAPFSPQPSFVSLGGGDHAGGVRAVIGLGESEAPDHFAARHLRQPLFSLVLGAEGIDRVHHQRALHRRERPHARIAPLELLHDQPIRDVIQPRAAILFREIRAEEAELRHAGDELLGKLAGDVRFADDGHQIVVDPLANGVADRALFFAEQAVDVVEIHAVELRSHQSQAPSKVQDAKATPYASARLGAGDLRPSGQMPRYQRAESAAWPRPTGKR